MNSFRRPGRRHPNWLLRGCLLAVAAISLIYLVVSPLWIRSRGPAGYEFLAGFVDLACAAWAFGVGSAIGSFLNVVAWRLPRGKSVNGRSHCPYCDQAIAARDNLPVFGWILLRGRCRNCRLPISARYPIVEFLVGSSLMILGLVVLYRGRGYLPFAEPHYGHNWPLRVAILEGPEYFAMAYLYATAAFVWAMALIRYDGHRIPKRLTGIAVFMVIASSFAVPSLQPMPWQWSTPLTEPWQNLDRTSALISLGLGALAGCLSACVWVSLSSFIAAASQGSPSDQQAANVGTSALVFDTAIGWSILGAVLGWQSFVAALPFVLLLAVALGGCLPKMDRSARFLFAAVWVMPWVIVCWPIVL